MNNVKDINVTDITAQPLLNDAVPAELAAPGTVVPPFGLDRIEDAVRAIAAGRPVLVVDNEDRENEGDIIFAAQHATPALMGWTIRYSSGVICVPLDGGRADALALPPMAFAPRPVSASVVGINPTSNHGAGSAAGLTAVTVSETPSTAMEPFSAM